MSDLKDLRAKIDALDDRLLELLKDRADVVAEVAEKKRDQQIGTVDPERENDVLHRVLEKGAGKFPKEAILAVFREILSASVSLQSEVIVAFLGPAGTFSHIAARTLFGYAPSYLEVATIDGVFDAVKHGRAAFGVVPVESSAEGSVSATIDGLIAGGCVIRREVVLRIEHCLMSHASSLSHVERVYSHPQALAQCRNWLGKSVPDAQLIHTASTAAAVQQAMRDRSSAAIGSALASELYSMPVLAERIQDAAHNETRFAMIGKDLARATGDDKTTLAFSIADDSARGSLRRTLAALDDNGVNMTRIESRPSRVDAWRYVFVVDVEGHADDEMVKNALVSLRERCDWVKVLGSYPRYPRA
jgi:chorismate mutase/prephenate dehydratase